MTTVSSIPINKQRAWIYFLTNWNERLQMFSISFSPAFADNKLIVVSIYAFELRKEPYFNLLIFSNFQFHFILRNAIMACTVINQPNNGGMLLFLRAIVRMVETWDLERGKGKTCGKLLNDNPWVPRSIPTTSRNTLGLFFTLTAVLSCAISALVMAVLVPISIRLLFV